VQIHQSSVPEGATHMYVEDRFEEEHTRSSDHEQTTCSYPLVSAFITWSRMQ
jgi:hypothetical protein